MGRHDSPFPNGVNNFLAVEEISQESKRKIAWDNAAEPFGFESQQPVPPAIQG